MQTQNTSQVEHFDALSSQWWDQQGAFGVLHSMNPARVRFIKEIAGQSFTSTGLRDLQVLDVGCGGGIVCEPLARLGANVTGIDASPEAINIASSHALGQNLDIIYQCCDLSALQKSFDLITCLEVVEHVDDLKIFAHDLVRKLNPGGILILSTLNRTLLSYLVGIIGAEYLTRKVPLGTHDWKKFIEPAELVALFENFGMQVMSLKGLNYSLYKREWYLGGRLNMNYLAAFKTISRE